VVFLPFSAMCSHSRKQLGEAISSSQCSGSEHSTDRGIVHHPSAPPSAGFNVPILRMPTDMHLATRGGHMILD